MNRIHDGPLTNNLRSYLGKWVRVDVFLFFSYTQHIISILLQDFHRDLPVSIRVDSSDLLWPMIFRATFRSGGQGSRPDSDGARVCSHQNRFLSFQLCLQVTGLSGSDLLFDRDSVAATTFHVWVLWEGIVCDPVAGSLLSPGRPWSARFKSGKQIMSTVFRVVDVSCCRVFDEPRPRRVRSG